MLRKDPRDWEALVILTEDALRRGDREAAVGFTARMPKMFEPTEWAAPWSWYPHDARKYIYPGYSQALAVWELLNAIKPIDALR